MAINLTILGKIIEKILPSFNNCKSIEGRGAPPV
jgi:hypothetical protein